MPKKAPAVAPTGFFLLSRGRGGEEVQPLDDAFYMRLALQLAESAQGQTGINPVVGCVIVKDGRIVGTGAHLARGGPHAEIHALQMAGAEAEGATVYVTLEPCSHYGRTPPCAERLIRGKVGRVVVACPDPNPQVAGRGIARLREAGIRTEVGLMEREARELNAPFAKFITTGKPFVTLKAACSLDGKIATRSGDSKWISNETARREVHGLRHRHQAVMVGVETVLKDDPLLTTRLEVPALQPVRLIVDSALRTPEDAAVVRTADRTPTWILTADSADAGKQQALERRGVVVLRCGSSAGRVDLAAALEMLGRREIGSILLEGGGKLNGAMLEAGLVDRVVLYVAPIIIGGADAPAVFALEGAETVSGAIRLERVTMEPVGDNLRVTGYPVRPAAAAPD